MMRCDRFLELGGYREELVHQGEEVEFMARAFLRDLYCYQFPGLRIYHTEANAGRKWQRMDFYAARNAVLWNDWYMPSGLIAIKQLRGFVARMIQVAMTRRLGHIKGLIAGLQEIHQFHAYHRRMPLALYRKWKR